MTENYICPDRNSHITGFNALYDIMDQSELPEGSIVVAILGERKYIFQTNENADVMDDDRVELLYGTLVTLDEDNSVVPSPSEVDGFYMENLRFPTRQELELYENTATI